MAAKSAGAGSFLWPTALTNRSTNFPFEFNIPFESSIVVSIDYTTGSSSVDVCYVTEDWNNDLDMFPDIDDQRIMEPRGFNGIFAGNQLQTNSWTGTLNGLSTLFDIAGRGFSGSLSIWPGSTAGAGTVTWTVIIDGITLMQPVSVFTSTLAGALLLGPMHWKTQFKVQGNSSVAGSAAGFAGMFYYNQ